MKKLLTIKFAVISFFILFFFSFFILPTFAADPPCAVPLDHDGRCNKVDTAFGALGVEPSSFISSLFGILLAASGSIALLLMMRAGYQIMTARGNPEGIKEGRERLVAAILGLIFLIFSFVLLEVIGVDLLQIPGFTGSPSSSSSSGGGGGGSGSGTSGSCYEFSGWACMPSTSCSADRSVGQMDCASGEVCCNPF